jgi:hypothetical protein
VVSVARDEDEPYVARDEGIGNRRDRPAFEISVEDRKIEVGFPRRFQRLVDASASTTRIITSSSTMRSLACFAGCASVATLHSSPGTGTYPGRKSVRQCIAVG